MLGALIKNKILITVLVLILGAAGYYYFVASRQAPEPEKLQEQELGEEVFAALEVYRGLNLQTPLFSQPAFTTLENMSAPVPSVSAGREDPFAPAS